ncbi:helix-turn-helix domain-containing protein [Saliphagus sp. LR7]|uniref:MarR family transcriptional regulator n=1 Tax=Saliphagus sp. LR7 TaxID=2282654 RepID=UPI000DF7A38E|nr:helix-turn-helix domain-containing protein [Saliphagus sp. LR7]
MAITTISVNEDHGPTPHEEHVLEVLKIGRDDGEPWGFTTPSRVAEYYDIPRQRVNEAIDRLEAAGWIEQETVNGSTIRGLYRFVGDPRTQGSDP